MGSTCYNKGSEYMTDNSKQYFYPYCSRVSGWCTKVTSGCKVPHPSYNTAFVGSNYTMFSCKYYRLKHPVSKQLAVMVTQETVDWMKSLTENGGQK